MPMQCLSSSSLELWGRRDIHQIPAMSTSSEKYEAAQDEVDSLILRIQEDIALTQAATSAEEKKKLNQVSILVMMLKRSGNGILGRIDLDWSSSWLVVYFRVAPLSWMTCPGLWTRWTRRPGPPRCSSEPPWWPRSENTRYSAITRGVCSLWLIDWLWFKKPFASDKFQNLSSS